MKLSEQKRLHILDAAEALFYEQGVENTSMDQVASRANVSKRTVYNHFDTKDALFNAIITRMQNALNESATVVFDVNLPVDIQLKEIAQQEVRLLTSENFLRIAKIAFMHMLQQPELAKQLGDSKVGCMTYLETFLNSAVASGQLVIDDVELAAKQFVYQLKSFFFYPHLYGFEVPDPNREEYIIDEAIALFVARYASLPSNIEAH